MTNHADLKDQLRREVESMHEVLAAWFRGEGEKDRATFNAQLVDRFAADLTIIYPSGSMLTRAALFDPIFDAHGSNPPFRVTIRDFQLITISEDGCLAIACYIEDQFNAKNTTPPDNARRSTVVFRKAARADRFEWLHIHETAIA